MDVNTLEYADNDTPGSLKQKIQEIKDEIAQRQWKITSPFPKCDLPEKIPLIGGKKNVILSLEQEVLAYEQKLMHILDTENELELLINTLIETERHRLNVREWNKATILTEIIDIVPFSPSLLISLPVTVGSYISKDKFKTLRKDFHTEVKSHKHIISLEHIDMYAEGILLLDIIETGVEFFSFFYKPADMAGYLLGPLKIGFSLKNKKVIKEDGIEYEKTRSSIIKYLEGQKKTLRVT